MSWTVETDDSPETVILSHEDGVTIYGTQGLAREYGFDFEIEVIKAGTVVEKQNHTVEDEDHLWEILDQYTEKYPSG